VGVTHLTPAGSARRALGVLGFGVAFGYVEAAVVLYLQEALTLTHEPLFPLRQVSGEAARLLGIEVGRELATLVMLGAIGWLAGSRRWERLAWFAVAFGAWDLAYNGWLWVFSGWPPTLTTWDVLFLVPAPWVAPVWAPMVVSLALIAVGLLAVQRLPDATALRISRWQIVGGLAGGALVVTSFLLDAQTVLAGGVPRDYPWPLFLAGMLLATGAALGALRGSLGGEIATTTG